MEQGMESHAVSSGGRYFVWNSRTHEVRGPFYPKDRTERLAIFVRETGKERDSGNWSGAYWRQLPIAVRREANRLVGAENRQ